MKKTLNKYYIPFEEASKLKSLGFREYCDSYYNEDGKIIKSWNSIDSPNNMSNSYINRPLYSQVFDWFREEHRLMHIIDGVHSIEPFELDCSILNIKNGTTHIISYSGNDYNQAELECIRRLIKVIKK